MKWRRKAGRTRTAKTDLDTEYWSLYKREFNGLTKSLAARGVAYQDLEDTAQASFLQLYEALKQGKPINDSVEYLYGIARNEIKQYWKRKGRAPVTLEGEGEEGPRFDPADPSANPEQEVGLSELGHAWEEFARRHPKAAECFSLAYFRELSIKELAAVLGKDPEKVRKYDLYDARKKARAFLKERGFGPSEDDDGSQRTATKPALGRWPKPGWQGEGE